MSEPHIHDCTGPDMRCHCGHVFTVPRFCFGVDAYDNQTKQTLVNEHGNCETLSGVIHWLEEAINTLKMG